MSSKLFERSVILCAALLGVFATALPVSGVTYETRAMSGDQAPGSDVGVVYGVFGTPVINGVGQVAFPNSLAGTGVTTTTDQGLWSEGSGSLSLVAREGFAAQGTTGDLVYSGVSSLVINDAGQVAFRGTLTGTGVTGANNKGI